jgi:hypothetical protein
MRRILLALSVIAALAAPAPAGAKWDEGLGGSTAAGPPPKRLDRNLGWVLSHPRIHNLFWHANWDTNNPAFTRSQLNAFTAALVSNGYLAGASQYGVGSAKYAGFDRPSSLCGRRTPPATVTSLKVLAWVTCEVTKPGTGVPYPRSRSPISNDVYVVYLPRSTTISDNLTIPRFTIFGHTFGPWTLYARTSCVDYDGYHFLSFGGTSLFAYAVVTTSCARGIEDVTPVVSHELVEVATDPVPTAGWIDDSISIAPPTFNRLLKGEAADICSAAGAAPTPPVNNGSYWFAPYWSNRAAGCVS